MAAAACDRGPANLTVFYATEVGKERSPSTGISSLGSSLRSLRYPGGIDVTAGTIVGIDPHRRTLTATVIDERGVELGHEHFDSTTNGYQALLTWATEFGPVQRWGVENAGSLGRHLAVFLIDAGHDVRDVPPHRTANRRRGRHEGKSDVIDSHQVAKETQTSPRLAHAFKNAKPAVADERREKMALWHNARKSLTRIRVQLLGEIDMLIHDLPEPIRVEIATSKTTRAKINAFDKLERTELDTDDTVLQLRLSVLTARIAMLRDVLDQDRIVTAELTALVESPDRASPALSVSLLEQQPRSSSK